MTQLATQTAPQTTHAYPVNADTYPSLTAHERTALARAFGQAPDSGDDRLPHERSPRFVVYALTD